MFKAVLNIYRQIYDNPLNKGRRIKAFGRFFRWQISSRLMKGPIAFPFVEDTSLLARNGQAGATGNWYSGLHELPEMGFVLHFLRENDQMVDVGANVGSYTILAAGGVGANVIAVEPVPQTFDILKSCVTLNKIENKTQLFCCGLSEAPGMLKFSSNQDTTNHVVEDDEEGSINVPVKTLDEICASQSPVLLKIDVEGHEAAVLRGGKETLGQSSLQAIIMETNGLGQKVGVTNEDLLNCLEGYGFVPTTYDPFTRSISVGVVTKTNTIFLKNPDEAESRCKASKSYSTINGYI